MEVLKKATSGVFVLIIVVVAMCVSLPGAYDHDTGASPNDPLTLEDLIPEGLRSDSGVDLRVLIGSELVEMTMERYLFSVLSAEMPASFELEALKAQAVAARTNVMHNIHVMSKENHPNAHVCTDHLCCTAFSSDERLRERWGDDYLSNMTKIITAVVETDGVYLSYQGEPILAVFHSSSAGKTETSGNVWMMDMPYLISVDSPETAENVPGFISEVIVSGTELRETISSAYPQAVFGDDTNSWIRDITHTGSGRIFDLVIGGVAIRGTVLRSMFNLRSTAVSIKWVDNDVVFTTTGFGHGVGMSQYGANTMAAEGKGYREILRAYYTGVTISGTAPA